LDDHAIKTRKNKKKNFINKIDKISLSSECIVIWLGVIVWGKRVYLSTKDFYKRDFYKNCNKINKQKIYKP
jgi:hypothetical protein